MTTKRRTGIETGITLRAQTSAKAAGHVAFEFSSMYSLKVTWRLHVLTLEGVSALEALHNALYKFKTYLLTYLLTVVIDIYIYTPHFETVSPSAIIVI